MAYIGVLRVRFALVKSLFECVQLYVFQDLGEFRFLKAPTSSVAAKSTSYRILVILYSLHIAQNFHVYTGEGLTAL